MSKENKYNIKVNPKVPSSKEIQKKMNFEGAYKAYTHKAYRTPWAKFQRHSPKNRKASMFIILALVVGQRVELLAEVQLQVRRLGVVLAANQPEQLVTIIALDQ